MKHNISRRLEYNIKYADNATANYTLFHKRTGHPPFSYVKSETPNNICTGIASSLVK